MVAQVELKLNAQAEEIIRKAQERADAIRAKAEQDAQRLTLAAAVAGAQEAVKDGLEAQMEQLLAEEPSVKAFMDARGDRGFTVTICLASDGTPQVILNGFRFDKPAGASAGAVSNYAGRQYTALDGTVYQTGRAACEAFGVHAGIAYSHNCHLEAARWERRQQAK